MTNSDYILLNFGKPEWGRLLYGTLVKHFPVLNNLNIYIYKVKKQGVTFEEGLTEHFDVNNHIK